MTNTHHKNCRLRSLVRGNVARINRCGDCGCVSIHVGATTIRIDEHTLRSFWLTVGEAIEQLDGRESLAYGAALVGRRAG